MSARHEKYDLLLAWRDSSGRSEALISVPEGVCMGAGQKGIRPEGRVPYEMGSYWGAGVRIKEADGLRISTSCDVLRYLKLPDLTLTT